MMLTIEMVSLRDRCPRPTSSHTSVTQNARAQPVFVHIPMRVPTPPMIPICRANRNARTVTVSTHHSLVYSYATIMAIEKESPQPANKVEKLENRISEYTFTTGSCLHLSAIRRTRDASRTNANGTTNISEQCQFYATCFLCTWIRISTCLLISDYFPSYLSVNINTAGWAVDFSVFRLSE